MPPEETMPTPSETPSATPTYESMQQHRAREVMRHTRMDLKTACLLVLCILAVFYTLYFAASIILPMILALVVNLLLSSPMRFLHLKLTLPKPLAALVLILGVFGVVGAIGTAISVPAAGWIERAPEAMNALGERLAFLRGPIHLLNTASARIESFINIAGSHLDHATKAGGDDAEHIVMSTAPASGGFDSFGSSLLLGTRAFVGQFFTMILMLFFLLAQGDSLLRRFVEIMPTFADKRRTVQIAYQIERNVSLYLATITIINFLVGLANMLQCWLLGMPNPLLWGVMAFLLNYIPIIGPMMGITIYFLVGLFTFPSVLQATLPPAIYLCIHLTEGETITPMVLARRFTLNPVLVMGSLMFWDWLWGIGGAFLSVPLLAVFKIICDHVDILTPIGHIVGGPTRGATTTPLFTPDMIDEDDSQPPGK
ncbi:AI-2E family transporter [Novacetimonas hansenii]|uniref:AI-2E family transporter n=1 Tax=Novacetimonas hansenii TaxID=436 RepID=UPI0007969CB3|nr:AI-2E family transporter [Novacetimonas hansenii]WEQ58115.1 AI-2E family transporter [Novacetimonas hansenii]CUW45946.1 AI-2 transport protein TqsA [Novacetimonas hansenii]